MHVITIDVFRLGWSMYECLLGHALLGAHTGGVLVFSKSIILRHMLVLGTMPSAQVDGAEDNLLKVQLHAYDVRSPVQRFLFGMAI
jgi:hypothetical protein